MGLGQQSARRKPLSYLASRLYFMFFIYVQLFPALSNAHCTILPVSTPVCAGYALVLCIVLLLPSAFVEVCKLNFK